MFLQAKQGRYWVELIDQATADWESYRMDHAVGKYFEQARRDRRRSPPGEMAGACFFSLRDRNANPVSTAMVMRGRIQIGVGVANAQPFPRYEEDFRILAAKLSVSFDTSCYPYGRSSSR